MQFYTTLALPPTWLKYSPQYPILEQVTGEAVPVTGREGP
jgi:hypothetical protein